jgi:predicted AlkP superfamily phosphohydrolase/phosphomutase
VVAAGVERDRLRIEVAERLLELRNADSGERLVEQVTTTSDLWDGPMRHALPDLLVDWNMSHAIERVSSPRIGEVTDNQRSVRSGDHATSKEGLLFGRPAGEARGQQPTVHVIDLAPTVLRLLEVSDHCLPGKVIPYLAS